MDVVSPDVPGSLRELLHRPGSCCGGLCDPGQPSCLAFLHMESGRQGRTLFTRPSSDIESARRVRKTPWHPQCPSGLHVHNDLPGKSWGRVPIRNVAKGTDLWAEPSSHTGWGCWRLWCWWRWEPALCSQGWASGATTTAPSSSSSPDSVARGHLRVQRLSPRKLGSVETGCQTLKHLPLLTVCFGQDPLPSALLQLLFVYTILRRDFPSFLLLLISCSS